MEDERGKKLLSNLKAAFSRDHNIEEYDYLPVLEPTHNCNPMVLVEHKLGVELWASKVLFEYAYQRLLQWRRKLPQARDIDPIGVLNLTRAVLLFNADNATAWNVRKELVQNKTMTIAEDLQLGNLILSKHPKSPETFAHRKWLLSRRKRQLLESLSPENSAAAEPNSNINDNSVLAETNSTCSSSSSTPVSSRRGLPEWFVLSEAVRDIVQGEMLLCALAAEKYPNNYNAWSHRIWTLQHFTDNHPQILGRELQRTEDWTGLHVSDYSGFHYRQYLLASLGFHNDHLDAELSMVTDLIERYPGHESLWSHRRFIVQSLLNQASSCTSSSTTAPPTCSSKNCTTSSSSSSSSSSSASQVSKKTRILPQCEVVQDTEEDYCSSILHNSKYSWQKRLAEKHSVWLSRAVKNN